MRWGLIQVLGDGVHPDDLLGIFSVLSKPVKACNFNAVSANCYIEMQALVKVKKTLLVL